jgi:hypothetical protein
VNLGKIPDDLREAIDRCSLIIAKGMANYEALTEHRELPPTAYLMAVKCPTIAEEVGVPEGSLVAILEKYGTGSTRVNSRFVISMRIARILLFIRYFCWALGGLPPPGAAIPLRVPGPSIRFFADLMPYQGCFASSPPYPVCHELQYATGGARGGGGSPPRAQQ